MRRYLPRQEDFVQEYRPTQSGGIWGSCCLRIWPMRWSTAPAAVMLDAMVAAFQSAYGFVCR